MASTRDNPLILPTPESLNQQIDLSVVIVNYNGGDELLACLGSLAAGSDGIRSQVIVVDNESSDGSLERAKSAYPLYEFVALPANIGFAAGCNRGLSLARGRHAMLLNPDTEVEPGTFQKLVAALDDHPEWGIVGAEMTDLKGHPYRAARKFPRPKFLFLETIGLTRLFPHSYTFGDYLYGCLPLDKIDNVDQVEGSALAIRGDVRSKIGDLDERFFIFFEEVDWCKRVRDAGFEIHVVRGARVRHARSATMSKYFAKIRCIHAESAMKYFQKHEGARGLARLRRTMRTALWIREWITRSLAIFSLNERALIRADAARAERAVYRKGLGA